jgi:hypothetical protein
MRAGFELSARVRTVVAPRRTTSWRCARDTHDKQAEAEPEGGCLGERRGSLAFKKALEAYKPGQAGVVQGKP